MTHPTEGPCGVLAGIIKGRGLAWLLGGGRWLMFPAGTPAWLPG